MKYNLARKLVKIKDAGQIGAGKAIPFPVQKLPRLVALPVTENPKHYITRTVCGNSLEGRGVNDGDILICKTSFYISEIKKETVCIITFLMTGEETAKMLTFNEDETITLRGANIFHRNRTVFRDEIEITAIVTDIQKSMR